MDQHQPTFDVDAVARLRRVIGKLARLLNESASEEGLSPSQASVLAVVGSRGPQGLGDLSAIEGINPTMLSRIVGKLDKLGLIHRTPNPADQRAALVEATELGRATSQRIRARRTDTVTRILDDLPPETAETLHAALPALEALAGGLTRPGRPASTRA